MEEFTINSVIYFDLIFSLQIEVQVLKCAQKSVYIWHLIGSVKIFV